MKRIEVMSLLVETMKRAIQDFSLLNSGQTIVVAVSGGADSTVLLHTLAALRKELQIGLIGAHLNHGFRGEEADEDAEFVRDLCSRLSVPSVIEFEDVPDRMKRSGLSAQVSAREARHSFLRRVMEEAGAERIALGHNRNDKIETILLNLLRGSGLEGLSPLPEAAFPLIRPLIHVSRAEIETYCIEVGLHFRTDSSNSKTDYRRNRMRSELLPYLSAHFNPRVDDALIRLSELAGEDNSLLEELADERFIRLRERSAEDRIVLNRESLLLTPRALQRRMLRRAVSELRGDRQNLTFETVEGVLEALGSGLKGSVTLPSGENGLFLIRYDSLQVSVEPASIKSSPISRQIELAIPGITVFPGTEWQFETKIVKKTESVLTEIALRDSAEESGTFEDESLYIYLVALDLAKLPLNLRSWRQGDRMRPKGMQGTKKLQDIFIDKKIPVSERHRKPILVDSGDDGDILAVMGVQSSEVAVKIDLLNPILQDCHNQDRLLIFVKADTSKAFNSY